MMFIDYIKNFFSCKIAATQKSIKPMLQKDMQNQKDKFIDITLDDVVQKIANTVQQYVKKGSMEYVWFFDRYIAQDCHIEDFEPNGSLIKFLQSLKKYYSLPKQKKKQLKLTKDISFQKMIEFVNGSNIIQKNQQDYDKKFPTPNLPTLNIPNVNKYNVYALSKYKHSDFEQMNRIYRNQVSWCVITGSATWGKYLTDTYNNYYMVTTKSNQPVLLMNFGSEGQIKNIHNSLFSAYDQQLFQIVRYLTQRDGFDPNKASDFVNYLKLKRVMNNQVNKNNLQLVQNVGKYQVYKQNDDYYFYINEQPCFIISNKKTLIRVGKSHAKIDQDVIQFIKKYKLDSVAYNLLTNKIVQQQNRNIYDDVFDMVLNYISTYYIDSLYLFFTQKMVSKNRQDLVQKILDKMHPKSFSYNIEKILNTHIIDYNQPYMKTFVEKIDLFQLQHLLNKQCDLFKNKKCFQYALDSIISKIDSQYNDFISCIMTAFRLGLIDQNNKYFDKIFHKILYNENASFYFNFFKKIIKQNDKYYNQLIQFVLKHQPQFIITSGEFSQNNQTFNKSVDFLIDQQATKQLHGLIVNKYITKNYKKYDQIIDLLIQKQCNYDIKELLKYNRLDKKGVYFDQIVNKLMQDCPQNAYFLISNKIITQDMQKFNQILQNYFRYSPQDVFRLVCYGYISQKNKYFDIAIKQYVQKCPKSGWITDYESAKRNKLFILVTKILKPTSNLYKFVLDHIASKQHVIFYYLMRYYIDPNIENYIEYIKKLDTQKLYKILYDEKVTEQNCKCFKQILNYIAQKSIWYIFKFLFSNKISKSSKYFNYSINLLMKQNQTYYIYSLIDNWNITDDMNVFQKCLKFLIKQKYNKRQVEKLSFHIRNNPQYHQIINKYVKNVKLSYQLYKLSKDIVDDNLNNNLMFFNSIFNFVKNIDFIFKNSKSVQKILKQNSIIIAVKFNKNIEFIKTMNIVLVKKLESVSVNIDVFCSNKIFDNKYYIPIERILSNVNKEFSDENMQNDICNYLKDLFERFKEVYDKQQPFDNLNQQQNNEYEKFKTIK